MGARAGANSSVIRLESIDDPRIADYQLVTDPSALRRAGLFVAEGRMVVSRLLASARFRVRSILVTPVALDGLNAARERIPNGRGDKQDAVPVYVLDQSLMDSVVGFHIHRGCVALAERPTPINLSDLPLASLRRLLVLEGVGNPDNIGGLFRSAAALGVDAVILGPGCGDPLYRKAIRTSMAATLQMPFADAGAWPDALGTLGESGRRVLALTPAPDAIPLEAIPRTLGRYALLVGTEGAGLTPAAIDASHTRVRISMTDAVDSLNVVVATSIALHHLWSPGCASRSER